MRRIKSFISIVLAAVLFMLAAASCGKDSSSSSTYEIEGLEISDIRVVNIQENSFDFIVGVKNTSSEEKSLDMRKFRLMLNDETSLPHLAGKTQCKADKYEEFSFMIDSDHPSMAKGDSITVYYDNDKLCEIKITDYQ